ncbi:uncharacterized protein K02A2.6-like [Eupeodes corollae]|uniref:uncharacterized protein K02A2.6-like n=1 Tax=Eupeodes corollae TaxID=290404 RepID=UPI002490CDC3|nr:uncharacterized protein K02A2.6-like [Eupeodes corollae]
MDLKLVEKLLAQQKQWMESVLQSNADRMEKIFQNSSSSMPATPNCIPQFRAFSSEKETWENYLFQLQQHFKANAVEDDNLKKANFLSTCGNYINEVLQKLFETTDVSIHTFKELTTKLTKHFQTKLHVLASRCKFLQRKMSPSQTYAEWIADLRGLARDCKFVCTKEGCGTSYADFMIRDMIVYYTPHESVHMAATQKKDPTLGEIEELVTAFESTQTAAEILKGNVVLKTPSTIEVNQLSHKREQQYPSKSNEHFFTRKSCPGCLVHHDRDQCKHMNSVCNNCNRRGHISTVCLSSKNTETGFRKKSRQRSKSRRRRSSSHSFAKNDNRSHPSHRSAHTETNHSINEINEDGLDPDQVSSAQWELERKGRQIFVSLHVNQQPMLFQLDTGATCSLVGLKGYQALGNPPCEPTSRSLKAYGGVSVPIKGVVHASVQYENKIHSLSFLVSDYQQGANIMGLDWFEAFDFSINYSTGESVLQVVKGDALATAAKSICEKYKAVFTPELGGSKLFTAHLTLKPNSQPRYFKHRPVPFGLKEAVRAEITRLQELGILRPIETSQWEAPIVVVKKANGSLRICGDFHITINPQLEIDRHPIPRIQELFHKLQGGQYFTKVDLSDAYLQVPLDDESKKLCVISTQFGLFEYQRLPFGTSSSTGIFQRYIEQLTSDIDFCTSYLDDIIVSGRTDDEHLHNLQILLERLERHGLRCRLEKCQFAKSEINYLGHIIDAAGICPSEARVAAIRDLPEPRNLKDLEAFIGKLNYYNQFIKNFAQVAAPLNKLRLLDQPFVWGKISEELLISSKTTF